MVQEGAGIIAGNIQKYNIQCDYKPKNLFAAYTAKHMKELEAKQKLWRSHGMDDHELLDKNAMHTHVGTDVYYGGMIDHSGAHVHPLNLALGEAAAVEANGGIIYEDTLLVSLEKNSNGAVVKTTSGQVLCKKVVLCGNAYLGKVIPKLTARVMPVSTQIIATEPLDADLARELLPTDLCVEDVRYILDYFRLSADKRLLFGGGTVYGGTDPKDVVAKLRPNMEKVFPQMKGIDIDYAWSGNLPCPFHECPNSASLRIMSCLLMGTVAMASQDHICLGEYCLKQSMEIRLDLMSLLTCPGILFLVADYSGYRIQRWVHGGMAFVMRLVFNDRSKIWNLR